MNAALTEITECLFRASSDVGGEYFQLPVAGAETPIYRERVYCYELYHRWRMRWPASTQYFLSGEIDKSGHPLIRNCEKPDFLVHVPGKMKNLLVVEVKPGNGDVTRMVDDLAKLTRFRREFKYEAAYFWIYGVAADKSNDLMQRLVQRSHSKNVDLQCIKCVIHSAAGERAVFGDWQTVKPNVPMPPDVHNERT